MSYFKRFWNDQALGIYAAWFFLPMLATVVLGIAKVVAKRLKANYGSR